jgi:phosphate transport system substrate-binding protein
MRRLRIVACLVFIAWAALGPLPRSARPAFAAVVVNGGGSSFAKLEFDAWTGETAPAPYNLKVNYVSQGSTFGRNSYVNGSLDFGASDIPFQPNEMAGLNSSSRKNFVYVPVSAGGLGLMYNLTDTSGNLITNLQLTRRGACQIFTAEDDLYWDEVLDIVSSNPGMALPHRIVQPIVRQDGSGTSYVLSEFCRTVAKAQWDAFVAAEKAKNAQDDPEFLLGHATSSWPTQFGHSGTGFAADGVAAVVADTPDTITYNEAGFAKAKNFPNALLQNAAGKFLVPTDTNVSTALGYASGNPDGTFKLNYTATDPGAYFPSTYSYVIAQTTGFDPAKGTVLAKFLCYAVTRGQRQSLTDKLDYARLSQPLVDLAHTAIEKIPGAPPWDQCAVAGAVAPPPAATTTTTTRPPVTTTKPGATTTTKPGTSSATTRPGSTATSITSNAGGGATTRAGSPAASAVVTPVTAVAGTPVTAADGSQITAAEIVVDTQPNDSQPVLGAPSDTPSGGDSCAQTASAPPPGASTDTSADTAVTAPCPTSAPVVAAQVSAKRAGPSVAQVPKSGVDGQQVTWVLMQGAGVCGMGVLLAGLSRREAIRR